MPDTVGTYVPLPAFLQTGGAVAVGPLSLWQMNNQSADTVLRVGLPLAAYLLRSAHRKIAIAAVLAAGVLWTNRLTSLNL